MFIKVQTICIFLFLLINKGIESSGEYDSSFIDAVRAYSDGKWSECYALIKKSLKEYKSFQQNTTDCCANCDQLSASLSSAEILLKDTDYVDRYRACITECYKGINSTRMAKVEKHFMKYDQYDYLQFCSYKLGFLEEAVSSAYTFHLANPNHEYAKNNVDHYRTMGDVQPSYFKNLEIKPYQELRQMAVNFYHEEEWSKAILSFENTLKFFYNENDNCRSICDHIATSESSAHTLNENELFGFWDSLLTCRKNCRSKLLMSDGVYDELYYAEIFNFLQFAYYKESKIPDAVRSAMSFLIFFPDDETMLSNKAFYQKLDPKLNFVSRIDALKYHKQISVEESILSLIKINTGNISRHYHGDYEAITSRSSSIYGTKDAKYESELKNILKLKGVTIEKSSEILMKDRRGVFDNVVSSKVADAFVKMAEIIYTKNDGNLKKGITVENTAELVSQGLVNFEDVWSLLETSESTRFLLEKYFNLKVTLYLQSTTLKCITPSTKLAKECVFQTEKACMNREGVDYHRDYGAIVYLNKVYEGGEFHYGSSKNKVEVKVGRLSAFDYVDTYELTPILSGKQCLLVFWFTLSYRHQETNQASARTLLKMHNRLNGLTPPHQFPVPVEEFMKSHDYQLSLTSDELESEKFDRYGVDSVATETACKELEQLINFAGSEGSGYKKGYAFNSHEKFIGVTVLNAAYLAAEFKVSISVVELYLRLSDEVRRLTQKLIVPDNQQLYFAYTHLVCRTAIKENLERFDLSHPIHSDNCIMQSDNSCKKVRPAFTERDYSAILYLNENFTGGEFFFADKNMIIESLVKPKCGRVVMFNASDYHGVRPVLTGQRCALALWFTLDKEYDETAHHTAWNVLAELKRKAVGPHQKLEL